MSFIGIMHQEHAIISKNLQKRVTTGVQSFIALFQTLWSKEVIQLELEEEGRVYTGTNCELLFGRKGGLEHARVADSIKM